MKTTRIFLALFLTVWFSFSAYWVYTLIDNITWSQESTTQWSVNQNIKTINTGDLSFMNQWNDTQMIWNFFSWYYYDEAYGVFETDAVSGQEVRVASASWNCSDGTARYELEWYAYSENFGAVWFSNTLDGANIYICINDDTDSPSYGESYFDGYAYSDLIWLQSFDGIEFEWYTDIEDVEEDEDGVLGRFVKVDGIVSSTQNSLGSEFNQEIKILWDISKSALRESINKNVYSLVKNTDPQNGNFPYRWEWIWNSQWSSWDGKLLENGKVLFFSGMQENPENQRNVEISWEQNGIKTLIVEWGNIYITENITGDGVLWLIALRKWNSGWNIYVHPDVTDIHALMYAERSVISYSWWVELWWEVSDNALANQLYIKWSLFSENTLWWWVAPYECPFFIDSGSCVENTAKKYDLNYLRRYKLVTQFNGDGDIISKEPDYNGDESMMGNGIASDSDTQKPWYRKHSLIIEYNPSLQQNLPPLF